MVVRRARGLAAIPAGSGHGGPARTSADRPHLRLGASGQPTVVSPRRAAGTPEDGDFLADLNDVFEAYWHDRFAFTARIGEQLARALAYAHAMGQIHRDLKPSNVMIDRHGQVYLIDFGL